MNIVEINAFDKGSTGRIMMHIAEEARNKGHIVNTFSTTVFSTKGKTKIERIPNHHYFSSYFENFIHYALAQLTDGNGFYSSFATIRLIYNIKKINPDIILLHNIHEFCLNISLFFRYIKKKKINTIWTFHDCWAFTGHCMHYDNSNCDLWITGCKNCPQKNINPKSRVDRCDVIWRRKRKILSTQDTLTIVSPSEWLAKQVKMSFLKSLPVYVINNGIDTNVFTPIESDFRMKHNLRDKYLVLGVAADWNYLKGLDVFVRLANELGENYAIVLVGSINKREDILPANILTIDRTENQHELAAIYSAADVFVNPTREDTFPTVNIEALACGTPVITFCTGGSPEIIDNTCGIVVQKDDYRALNKSIIDICESDLFSSDNCVKRASKYRTEKSFSEYIKLIEEIHTIKQRKI